MDDRNQRESETTRLAEFISETEYEDLPDDIVERAKETILDIIGVTAYGSRQEPGKTAARYVSKYQAGAAGTIVGRGEASVLGAALANGTAAHATDFDDTYIGRPVIHPSAPVFSSLLPTAESVEAAGTDVLVAYTVGLEVTRRIGEAMNPNHYQHGFHSTGTIGSFGATAATSSLLGLPDDRIKSALALVASSSSTLKADNFGTMTKPYSAGHAASMGARATLLANEGFTGDPNVLNGRYGYGNVMTPGYYDSSAITNRLGEEWPGMLVKRKLFPCGSYYQGMCEAFRRLIAENELTPDGVKSIEVTFAIPSSARKKPTQPSSGIQGRFSAKFLLAAILIHGDLTIEHFTDEFVQAGETRRQMEKVSRRQSPSIITEPIEGGRHPVRSTAEVRVITDTGDEYVETQQYSPDSREHPIPEERYERKFTSCAETALRSENVETVKQIVADLENIECITDLTDELT